MKIKLAVLAIFIAGIFACTQRTCPTYIKDDIKKTEQKDIDV